MEWLNALLPKSSKTADLAGETPAPGKRTLDQGSTTGADAIVNERLETIKNRLLHLGVKPERLGDLSRVNITSSTRDLELLEWIAVGPGRRGSRGSTNAIIGAWNRGQDGLDNRAKWATILNYVHWLDEMSVKSMGKGYDEALAEMPKVRLGGAGVGGLLPVHPRAVYFCAAAQVGMDVRAGIEEGKGHYFPVGGFKNLFKDLKNTLEEIGMKREFPGALGVVNAVRGDLQKMLDVLAAQEAGVPFGVYRPEEHLEPAMRRKLLPLRAQIADVGIPTTDVEAVSVAARLAGMLGVAVPKKSKLDRNHGSGSIDPHGPGHAIGLAIDMFYGDGEGKYGHQNKAVKAPAWPFIHLLIAEKGPLLGLSPKLRPTSLGQVDASEARKIAELLHDHGPAFLEEVKLREQATKATAEDKRTYYKFRSLRRKAANILRSRKGILEIASKKVPSDNPLRVELLTEMIHLHRESKRAETQDPETLPLTIQAAVERLTALELRVDLAITKKTPDLDGLKLRDGKLTGKLATVITDLQAIREEAQPVVEALREQAAVKSANDPYTKSLIERAAQDDRLLFDQPSVMVEALNEVRTDKSVLEANHHWVVAPMKILESTTAYGDALRNDMTLRHKEREPPQLERVLGVMAESQGGRDILTATAPFKLGVGEFHSALSDVVGGDSFASAMIGRVATRVISPYEGKGKDKLGELRDRGYYLPTKATESEGDVDDEE
ncbi:MAG TPA: hypothetical protein VIU61_13630 [Kofleriaceae bacterium]